jgi:iron complex transport system substrate-binding protein
VRIVSLLESGTEIVCALGVGHMLVGRSHECDNPEWVRSLPACSEPAFDISVSSREIDAEVNRRIRSGEPLYRLHSELIRDLAPDLVITQSHCEVCAVTPADVERSGGNVAAADVLTLTAGSLDGIFQGIMQVARALGLEDKGCAVVRAEQERLARVRERTASLRTPTVVMLEWTDPLFAMGNWGPELVEIANGNLLLGNKDGYSSAISGEQVRAADPEYLIVASCGFTLERTWQDRAVLEAYPWWPELRSVQAGKVAFADGNLLFNRSGMTISQTTEIIAEILHGVTFGATTENYWRWLRQKYGRPYL